MWILLLALAGPAGADELRLRSPGVGRVRLQTDPAPVAAPAAFRPCDATLAVRWDWEPPVTLPVARGHEIGLEVRFRRRVHLVDQHPGFLRNEVHRPRPMRFDREAGRWVDDPAGEGHDEVQTWWRSLEPGRRRARRPGPGGRLSGRRRPRP